MASSSLAKTGSRKVGYIFFINNVSSNRGFEESIAFRPSVAKPISRSSGYESDSISKNPIKVLLNRFKGETCLSMFRYLFLLYARNFKQFTYVQKGQACLGRVFSENPHRLYPWPIPSYSVVIEQQQPDLLSDHQFQLYFPYLLAIDQNSEE